MDEDAPMTSNVAGSPVVQASVDLSPAVAEASACVNHMRVNKHDIT